MINLLSLPNPTKLVWEFTDVNNKNQINTCTIAERHGSNNAPQRYWRKLYFHKNNAQWMSDDKHLRFPTEEELKTLTWNPIK